jgi:hypothetical protein
MTFTPHLHIKTTLIFLISILLCNTISAQETVVIDNVTYKIFPTEYDNKDSPSLFDASGFKTGLFQDTVYSHLPNGKYAVCYKRKQKKKDPPLDIGAGIAETLTLVDGRPDGKLTTYYEDGQVAAERQYNNGNEQSAIYYWYDGVKFIEGHHENGVYLVDSMWEQDDGKALIAGGAGMWYEPWSYRDNICWYKNGVIEECIEMNDNHQICRRIDDVVAKTYTLICYDGYGVRRSETRFHVADTIHPIQLIEYELGWDDSCVTTIIDSTKWLYSYQTYHSFYDESLHLSHDGTRLHKDGKFLLHGTLTGYYYDDVDEQVVKQFSRDYDEGHVVRSIYGFQRGLDEQDTMLISEEPELDVGFIYTQQSLQLGEFNNVFNTNYSKSFTPLLHTIGIKSVRQRIHLYRAGTWQQLLSQEISVADTVFRLRGHSWDYRVGYNPFPRKSRADFAIGANIALTKLKLRHCVNGKTLIKYNNSAFTYGCFATLGFRTKHQYGIFVVAGYQWDTSNLAWERKSDEGIDLPNTSMRGWRAGIYFSSANVATGSRDNMR